MSLRDQLNHSVEYAGSDSGFTKLMQGIYRQLMPSAKGQSHIPTEQRKQNDPNNFHYTRGPYAQLRESLTDGTSEISPEIFAMLFFESGLPHHARKFLTHYHREHSIEPLQAEWEAERQRPSIQRGSVLKDETFESRYGIQRHS